MACPPPIPLYIGPGLGVGTIVIILLVSGLVLFSFGVIGWTMMKNAFRSEGRGRERRSPGSRLVRAVLLLFLLSLFASAVRHVSTGGRSLGRFTAPLETFASFPERAMEVFSSDAVRNIPDSYVPAPADFVPRQEVEYDLYGLNGFWDQEDDAWDVHLFNFRNDSVLHTWTVHRDMPGHPWKLDLDERLFENAPLVHSLLLSDRSLITKLNKTPNLIRLDRDSKVLWTNHDMVWHHSLHRAVDGQIWACGSDLPIRAGKPSVGRRVINLNGQKVPYQEDHIVKIDTATGRILYRKGVAEILVENGMLGRLYGGSLHDPIHLNDCNPVLQDGPYWKQGDLFLSVRGRSLLLLYRPSTGKVLRVVEGPLVLEHDVNILDDHRISIFNNRALNSHQYPDDPEVFPPAGSIPTDSLSHSQVLVYDMADSSFTPLYDGLFRSEGIRTMTQGLQEVLPSGDLFVEVQNSGVYHVLGPQGVRMRKAYATPVEGRVHGPNWTRWLSARPWPPAADDPRFRARLIPYAGRTATVAGTVAPVPPPSRMRTAIGLVACGLLLAIGLWLLQRPFRSLGERTGRLIDALLDRATPEPQRQQRLKDRALSESASLLVLVLALLALVAVAVLPLWAAVSFSWASMGEIDLLDPLNAICLLVATVLPFLVLPRLSGATDYSPWSRTFHRIVLENYHIGRYLFRRERRALSAATPRDTAPVLISGLARAGTTALTTLLARSPRLYALTYAQMPFLLAPGLWRRFYRPSNTVARERSHGDKVMFSLDSVEALEEYFFKVHLNDGYITKTHLVEHRLDAATAEAYADYRTVLRPKDRPDARYLAKNNNLVLRYASLKEHIPGLRVIFLFRDPLEHAASLMEQHARFVRMQQGDPFVREYMDWLGHHEFGQGLKSFRFGAEDVLPPGDPRGMDHWLRVWIAYYEHLLQVIDGEEVLLVEHAVLCREPRQVLERITTFTGISFTDIAVQPFEERHRTAPTPDPALLAKALELLGRLRVRAGTP